MCVHCVYVYTSIILAIAIMMCYCIVELTVHDNNCYVCMFNLVVSELPTCGVKRERERERKCRKCS